MSDDSKDAKFHPLEGEEFRHGSSAVQKQGHLRYLDSLRGFAILAVIVVHSSSMTLLVHHGLLYELTLCGQRGVQLFYVVSAFTLCYSFDVRPGMETHPLGNYFIRRFFRIAPLFYVAVMGNLLINGTGPTYDAPHGLTFFQILSGIFFLNGFHRDTINSIAMGGWSIAVETSFYLFLPLVLSFVNTAARSIWLLLISAMVAPAVSYSCLHFMPGERSAEYFGFFWFPIEFPVFCMGICAYYLDKEYGGKNIVGHRRLFSLVLIIVAFLIFASSFPITDKKLYWSSIAFIPLILGLSLCDWKLFVNPMMIFLGKISYSLYLMHFFCRIPIWLIWLHARHIKLPGYDPEDTLGGFLVVFACILLSAVPLSSITHLFIEKPGINLGRNLIQRREKAHISARI